MVCESALSSEASRRIDIRMQCLDLAIRNPEFNPNGSPIEAANRYAAFVLDGTVSPSRQPASPQAPAA